MTQDNLERRCALPDPERWHREMEGYRFPCQQPTPFPLQSDLTTTCPSPQQPSSAIVVSGCWWHVQAPHAFSRSTLQNERAMGPVSSSYEEWHNQLSPQHLVQQVCLGVSWSAAPPGSGGSSTILGGSGFSAWAPAPLFSSANTSIWNGGDKMGTVLYTLELEKLGGIISFLSYVKSML